MNNNLPLTDDLRVFVTVARRSSFVAAAAELGVSAAYVTKRVKIMEGTLGAALFNRTTRRVVITEDGERAYHWAQKILDDMDHLMEDISTKRQSPRGMLRVCSSFGFGQNIVGPALSQLVEKYPALQIRFEVFDRLVDVGAEGFDLDIRVGDEMAPHHIARQLAPNHRVLCAAPGYVQRHGLPSSLADLANHPCLIIKERDHPFGLWKLRNGPDEQTVKVRGPLSSNHGEIAVNWAVDGRGIVLRSLWDVGPLLQSGQLVQVLPQYTQEANLWAVFPARLETSAKVRVCVEWLQERLPQALLLHRR
ncbi:MAG: LysR substrate-binding domain-containing protein [Rhodoferax sp.]|nr:LysR substrate-binding domain-containing protein [Rhodoferax sp.]